MQNKTNADGNPNGYWEIKGKFYNEQTKKFYHGIRYKGHFVDGVDYGFWIERVNEKLYYAKYRDK
jgi:hypothetical protein